MEQTDEVVEFLEAMEHCRPTIPEEVVMYYLNKSGFSTDGPRM